MSFILDALQKDQVEQQQQPTATSLPHATRPLPVKRWGLWLVGAALLVNAALLGWYLLSKPSGATGSSTVPPSIPGAQRELAMAPAATPPASRTNDTANETARETRIPKRNPVRNPVTAPSRPASRTNSRPSVRTPSSSGSGRVLSPEQAAQMGIGDDLLSTQNQNQNQSENQDRAIEQPTRAEQPTPRSAPTSTTRSRAPDAITVAQLPTAARNSFPQLEFSTHIFADDPSMRAVVVNDKRLTEGEQLGELILRAVTEEGVVFGYRSHLVAVSVVELWAE